MRVSHLALLAASLVACRDADGSQEVRLRPAPVAPSPSAPQVSDDRGPHPADTRVLPTDVPGDNARDGRKGDQKDSDWVPKEYAGGMARWKDTGVYVDGKPLGFLTWGEMPIGCKPSWLKSKVSADKRYGTSDPGWRWERKRYYERG